ncbi:MAG: (deoxy)nucleoside triphosphate pyrophosphohydrolase [Verrucomicrobiales bacterium]|jgi:8-oxo-dGTP diphosphatase
MIVASFLGMPFKASIEVAAALIFDSDRLLIAQRPPGVHLEGLWEFPGGKREPGETYEACLLREIREELGCEVLVGLMLHESEHAYPEKCVRIRFFQCQLVSGVPKPLECAALRWVSQDSLGQFQFPEADMALIEQLKMHPEWW